MPKKQTETMEGEKELTKLYKRVEKILKQLKLANMVDVSLYKVYRPEDGNHYIWVTDRIGDAKEDIYITFEKTDDYLTIKEKIQGIIDKRQGKWNKKDK